MRWSHVQRIRSHAPAFRQHVVAAVTPTSFSAWRSVAGEESRNVTGLLRAWRDGDETALDELVPLVEAELRRLARAYMARERRDHTLQTTALVNEAFIRLTDARKVEWHDRAHFFAVSARMMRRVLVDHARGRGSHKRGGQAARVSLDEAPLVAPERDDAVLALDDALKVLETVDPRRARVVELRFFGGLNIDETAVVLQVSSQTIKRDWRLAKAWLSRELRQSVPDAFKK